MEREEDFLAEPTRKEAFQSDFLAGSKTGGSFRSRWGLANRISQHVSPVGIVQQFDKFITNSSNWRKNSDGMWTESLKLFLIREKNIRLLRHNFLMILVIIMTLEGGTRA